MATMKRIEKFLWRRRHRAKSGVVSNHIIARLTSWDGTRITRRLSDDLPTARKQLKELLAHDIHCRLLGVSFDHAERAARAKALAEKQEQDRQRHRLDIKTWLPLFRSLPSSQRISSGKRRNQPRSASTIENEKLRHDSLCRILGGVYLDDLSGPDLDRYVVTRSQEPIMRWGKPVKGSKVSSGSIRNELGALGLAHRAAKELGEAFRVAQNHPARIATLREETGLSEPILQALCEVARINPNPNFGRSSPRSGTRDRVLSAIEEAKYFAVMAKVAPVWYQRFVAIASETALDMSNTINLVESQIDFIKGEIRVVRPKTHQAQISPVTKKARAAILAQIEDRKKLPVKLMSKPVFWWDYDPSEKLTNNMVQHWHRQVCKAAGIEDFHPHDWRHVCATRWAKMPEITPAQFCLMMGWSQSAGQHQVYINLREGSIGEVFNDAGRI